MEEILFRGKRLDNDEWVEGNRLKIYDQIFIIPVKNGRSYRGIEKTRLAIDSWFEVDHKTVGQYIGVEDRYGKKIFEDDYIKTSYLNIDKHICDFTSSIEYIAGGYVIKFNSQLISIREWMPEIEVIGNIHDQ